MFELFCATLTICFKIEIELVFLKLKLKLNSYAVRSRENDMKESEFYVENANLELPTWVTFPDRTSIGFEYLKGNCSLKCPSYI